MSSKKKGTPTPKAKAPVAPKKPRKKPVDDGIPKADKAAVTRFCRDVLKDPTLTKSGLSVAKLRKAVWGNDDIRNAVIAQGSVVWRVKGFTDAVEALINGIPVSGARRKKMSPEERAEYNVARRDAILETAENGPVNEHSLAALKTAYLQGLKEDDRATAKAEFEAATADVLSEVAA